MKLISCIKKIIAKNNLRENILNRTVKRFATIDKITNLECAAFDYIYEFNKHGIKLLFLITPYGTVEEITIAINSNCPKEIKNIIEENLSEKKIKLHNQLLRATNQKEVKLILGWLFDDAILSLQKYFKQKY